MVSLKQKRVKNAALDESVRAVKRVLPRLTSTEAGVCYHTVMNSPFSGRNMSLGLTELLGPFSAAVSPVLGGRLLLALSGSFRKRDRNFCPRRVLTH